MGTERPGHKALEELDRALAQKPHKDGKALAAATLCLSQFREELISQQREKAPTEKYRKRLDHVNSVISVVLAAHFPLGSIPWDEVERARAWLLKLVSAVE